MKLVILAGGYGSRLGEVTNIIPKPMVEIGGKPILWHIMKIYSHYGIKDFVICLGYKANVIKDYFLNYDNRNNDFTIEIGSGNVEFHSNHDEYDWKVTLVDTGVDSLKGARLKKVENYLDDDVNLL
ncbi:MAG: sugar phosphate nucleotidyltransferase, partial [Paraclostridium bifermentans]